jgi:hypothetical protein
MQRPAWCSVRNCFALVACMGAVLAITASPAVAHGVQGRAETPVPITVFFWTAAIVIVVSFVALGVAWSTPKLKNLKWRPTPSWLQIFILPTIIWPVRVLVLAVFIMLLAAAAFGSTLLNRNIVPVSVFVVWWVGLVPLSLFFGDVWRQVNPWRTVATLLGAKAESTQKTYPRAVGMWPAVVLLVCWAWMELIYPMAAELRVFAGIMAVYSIYNVVGMLRFGVNPWLDNAEVFSVFTRLVSSLSVWETREIAGKNVLGLRPPLLGAVKLPVASGFVGFITALIGISMFDGLLGTEIWKNRDVAASERLIDLGIEPFTAGIIVATIGMLVMIAIVVAVYEFTSWTADKLGGLSNAMSTERVAETFAHSLVPIAVGYAIAHYFTLYVFQSQDLIRLISDPFGNGSDYFGSADFRINFNLVSANLIWTVQVGAIVVAHVVGLVLAHDRALQIATQARHAVRSQYSVLLLMVVLTVVGLWFLSEGMYEAS